MERVAKENAEVSGELFLRTELQSAVLISSQATRLRMRRSENGTWTRLNMLSIAACKRLVHVSYDHRLVLARHTTSFALDTALARSRRQAIRLRCS